MFIRKNTQKSTSFSDPTQPFLSPLDTTTTTTKTTHSQQKLNQFQLYSTHVSWKGYNGPNWMGNCDAELTCTRTCLVERPHTIDTYTDWWMVAWWNENLHNIIYTHRFISMWKWWLSVGQANPPITRMFFPLRFWSDACMCGCSIVFIQ